MIFAVWNFMMDVVSTADVCVDLFMVTRYGEHCTDGLISRSCLGLVDEIVDCVVY